MAEANSTNTPSNQSTRGDSQLQFHDSNSQYYLHPSDHPGTVFVTCVLNGDNYPTWRRAMLNVLHAKNKIAFVDGSLNKPDSTSADYLAWTKCNSMVISWFFNALSCDLHDSVAYAETARELWLDLEERFSQGNATRIHQLKKDLYMLQQDNKSVVAYYNRFKALWDELQICDTIPRCSCGAGKDFVAAREQEKVHQFLLGLNVHQL